MHTDKNYEFIKLEYLDDMAGGDDDFLVEMIDTYLSSIPESLARLREAVAEADHKRTHYYIHKLRGSYNFIGCTELGDILTAVESYSQLPASQHLIPGLMVDIFDQSSKITAELEALRLYKISDRHD